MGVSGWQVVFFLASFWSMCFRVHHIFLTQRGPWSQWREVRRWWSSSPPRQSGAFKVSVWNILELKRAKFWPFKLLSYHGWCPLLDNTGMPIYLCATRSTCPRSPRSPTRSWRRSGSPPSARGRSCSCSPGKPRRSWARLETLSFVIAFCQTWAVQNKPTNIRYSRELTRYYLLLI